MKFQDIRSLVTGGGAGIGRAIAEAFAARGASLVLLDIDSAKASEAAEAIEAAGGKAIAVVGSVTESADVARAFATLDETNGGIDILINNAGISANKPTLDLSDEDWEQALAVNLRGAFLCARAAGRRMTAQGAGIIINIASMYGIVAAPERLPYCVSKAGIVMMTKALAIEWADRGVRVNGIAPGVVDTKLFHDLVARGRVDAERVIARTPMSRLVTPAEVADAALYLASPGAAMVTGHIMVVDGGWTAYGYI